RLVAIDWAKSIPVCSVNGLRGEQFVKGLPILTTLVALGFSTGTVFAQSDPPPFSCAMPSGIETHKERCAIASRLPSHCRKYFPECFKKKNSSRPEPHFGERIFEVAHPLKVNMIRIL